MTTYNTLSDIRGDERIDSRDLIETAEAIRADVLGGESIDEDQVAILEAIDALEAEGIDEWEYGTSFIRADTFEEYAREVAEDIGAISADAQWPIYCIDWEQAARDLAMDYWSVTFLGHDYYVR